MSDLNPYTGLFLGVFIFNGAMILFSYDLPDIRLAFSIAALTCFCTMFIMEFIFTTVKKNG